MEHYATLHAYPIKEELGGGYRGVVFIRETKTRLASEEAFPSLDGARNWAKKKAHEVMSGRFYQLAPLRRKGSYQSNLWV